MGRDNAFNRKIVSEFSLEHEVLCCLFIEPERFLKKEKLKKIIQRAKKYGLFKALDELAFHFFDRYFLRKNEIVFWNECGEYIHTNASLNCPCHQVENINSSKWVELCNSLSPDIILGTCSQVIFKPDIYKIPILGTFMIHEGLTPEYKGLHTPLWALMKKEFNKIGYTVLKVNDKIDGGKILTQGTYSLRRNENYKAWSWVGHKAIISGMEDILRSFRELERMRYFIPLNITNRESGYYTWMQLSHFLKFYLKNYLRKTQLNVSMAKAEPEQIV